MSDLPVAKLRRGREKPLLYGHPWIFSGALTTSPDTAPGEVVDVVDHRGDWIGRGFCNPHSQIRVRLATRRQGDTLDEAWLLDRLEASVRRRAPLQVSFADRVRAAVRLVNAESDGLPGLIVDRHAHVAVVQFLTAAMERWREPILHWASALDGVRTVVDRSDEKVRKKEGLELRHEVVTGSVDDEVEIDENGVRFGVDVRGGHKTGFYLDQRRNRRRVAELARGRTVLNMFAFTGGFGVAAAVAGSGRTVNVDASRPALELAERNFARNGLDPEAHELIEADGFEYLRHLVDEGDRFGVVVLDPPKFAATRGQVDAACRGYKDLNRLALHLLEPGGVLATFSCSGLVDAELFTKVVLSAVVDARAEVEVLDRLQQDEDHPVLMGFPESGYLKGLLLRKR